MVDKLVEYYEGTFTVVIVNSAQSAATKMIDNANNFHGVAVKAVDLTFTSLIPALETLRDQSCESLAAKMSNNSTFTMPQICSSNNTIFTDLENESEPYKELIMATISEKIDPIKSFLRYLIEAGVSALSDVVVIFDPLEPW